jgi:HPt (histidine-containing phosphotransfer) domain-containing protein
MRLNENIDVINDESIKLKCTNLDYLNKHTKSNPALMMEMILLYLEQTPPLINVMKQSLLSRDWNLLHTAVHKIIPSFSIVGINSDFEKMAKKIHKYTGNQQDTDEIQDLVLQLESVCNKACVELEGELNLIKNASYE